MVVWPLNRAQVPPLIDETCALKIEFLLFRYLKKTRYCLAVLSLGILCKRKHG